MNNIVTDPSPGCTHPYHQPDAGMATPIAMAAKKSSANATWVLAHGTQFCTAAYPHPAYSQRATSATLRSSAVGGSGFYTGVLSAFDLVHEGMHWYVPGNHTHEFSLISATVLRTFVQEARTRRIDLSAHDPALLHAMITFLYIDDYYKPMNIVKAYSEETVDAEPDALFHLHLSVLADKYDIAALDHMSISRFHAFAEANWNKPCFADWVYQVNTIDTQRDSFIKVVNDIMAKHFLEIVQPTEDNQAVHHAGGSSFGFTVAQMFLAGHTWRCGGGCGTTFTMHESCSFQKYQVPNGTPTGCPCCGALAKKLEEWDPNRITGPGSVRLPRAENFDLWTPY